MTAPLHVTIDPGAASPPYEQLRAQIADQARNGALPAGYRLPTVRALAADLGLAANTVAKAYRTLEAEGLPALIGRGVYYGANASEAAQCQGDEVYIVGAANSAGQAALNLARFAARVHLVALDVALLREDAGDLHLELGVRHHHGLVSGLDAVADAGQKIGDRIGHRHLDHQLDFVMPGMKPSCASSRRHTRHRPNLR